MCYLQSILVTGGAGFIGLHLVKMLLPDYRVVIIDNLSSGKIGNIPKHQNVIFYKEDIRKREMISDIIKREKIDTCIHLAANTSVTEPLAGSDIVDVNFNGTARVLEACAKNNVGHFVYASSAAVYGEAMMLPIPEDHRLQPISLYGRSKLAEEKLVASFQESGRISSAISLRFFNVYGDGQNSRYAGVITKFAQRLSKGLPPIIYGNGKQTRDFVSVKDVVDAIILAMQTTTDVSGEFNIGTGSATSIKELAKEMTDIFGLDVDPIYEKAKPNEIIHSCADTTKSKKMLKFLAKDDLHDWLHRLYSKNG